MKSSHGNNNGQTHSSDTQPRAGWSVADWCDCVDIGRASYYALPPELQPASIKLGKRRIITEQPGDFLKRISLQSAAEGG